MCSLGESVSVIKHTDPVPDPRAVNQDKKNMLFSVSTSLPVLRGELSHVHIISSLFAYKYNSMNVFCLRTS